MRTLAAISVFGETLTSDMRDLSPVGEKAAQDDISEQAVARTHNRCVGDDLENRGQ